MLTIGILHVRRRQLGLNADRPPAGTTGSAKDDSKSAKAPAAATINACPRPERGRQKMIRARTRAARSGYRRLFCS